MGTPEFAVAGLNKLLEHEHEIIAVVTAPDKPSGRGMHTTKSAVKVFAEKKQLRILQPEKLKSPEFIQQLQELNADLQVVVAFRMLPEIVWNMPKFGTINLHASLLPDYRGAAPINWVIINGEKETGVTSFFLKHEIDTGDMLLQQKIAIDEEETAGSLHDKLMTAGADLILKSVNAINDESFVLKPQGKSDKIAPKIFKSDCQIQWDKKAIEIHRLIKGLSPYPGAYTFLNEKQLKIFCSHFQVENHSLAPAISQTDEKTYLRFACKDGFIYADEIQIEGKKRMFINDFLKGYRK